MLMFVRVLRGKGCCVGVSEAVGVSLVSMETFEVVEHPFVVVLGRGLILIPKS